MKKLQILFYLFLCSFGFAQSQDLFALAQGKPSTFSALLDKKDNLFGYMAIYDYGKSGDLTKKMEYVLLDKNLNPVQNKEFDADITVKYFTAKLEDNNTITLVPPDEVDYKAKIKDWFEPRAMTISLKDNTIAYKKIYNYHEDGTLTEQEGRLVFKEYNKNRSEDIKTEGQTLFSKIKETEDGIIVISNYEDNKIVKDYAVIKFDKNKKKLWQYNFPLATESKEAYAVHFIEQDKDHIFLRKRNIHSSKDYDFDLVVLNQKTGALESMEKFTGADKIAFFNILNYKDDQHNKIVNTRTFDDRYVYISNEKNKQWMPTSFVRITIDRKTLKPDVKKLNFLDFKPYFPKIDEMGYVRPYFLSNKDMFFLNDGSIGLLFEVMAWGRSGGTVTQDMVYAIVDKDFQLKDVKRFNKEISRWENSDYLFSQYLNGGKDVAFFYQDLARDAQTNDKQWNLYINTVIDGQFKQEVVPIAKKNESVVTPFIAKQGYILLQETSKDEKYSTIRLERLNY